jgi:hypothetical protein
MSGSVLELTLVLIVLTLSATLITVVWLILRYLGRGVGLPGNFALFVRGHSGEGGTQWEPFIVNEGGGQHDHTGDYATPDDVNTAVAEHNDTQHGPHDHDDRYSLLRHTHDQYVTSGELSRRLAALRVSNVPHSLFGALAIILATTLIGALIGLVLDLTVMRHWLNHLVLSNVTGVVSGKTVTLTPHFHVVTDWLQALGVITFGSIAGFLIGTIVVLVSWLFRRRNNNVVQEAN